MRILVFYDITSAVNRNNEEAVRRGCDGVTIYWWNMRNHPTRNEFALEIGDDEVQEGETVYEMGEDWNV